MYVIYTILYDADAGEYFTISQPNLSHAAGRLAVSRAHCGERMRSTAGN